MCNYNLMRFAQHDKSQDNKSARTVPDKMRRTFKIVLGVVLILVGVFALLTPLTPGSWLALIGLEILGLRILLERKIISIVPHKYRRKVRNLFKRKTKSRKFL